SYAFVRILLDSPAHDSTHAPTSRRFRPSCCTWEAIMANQVRPPDAGAPVAQWANVSGQPQTAPDNVVTTDAPSTVLMSDSATVPDMKVPVSAPSRLTPVQAIGPVAEPFAASRPAPEPATGLGLQAAAAILLLSLGAGIIAYLGFFQSKPTGTPAAETTDAILTPEQAVSHIGDQVRVEFQIFEYKIGPRQDLYLYASGLYPEGGRFRVVFTPE